MRNSFNLQSRGAFVHNVRNARITTFQIRLKQAMHGNLLKERNQLSFEKQVIERNDQIQKKVVTIKSVYLYRGSVGGFLIPGLLGITK